MKRHLARLGAALIAPRRALRARLAGGPGGLSDVLVWTLVAAAVLEPEAVGHGLVWLRADLVTGFRLLAEAWVDLVAPVIIAIVVTSLVGSVSARGRVEGGDVFDAAALALVPLVFLIGLGVVLETAGVPRDWLPLASPRGPWLQWGLAFAVRYGWSFAILLLLAVELRGTFESVR